MGNHTAIILIPPIIDSKDMLGFCNAFLKQRYTPENGWNECPSFLYSEMPFVPNILIGEFSYFHLEEFINYLKGWFHPKPSYRIGDEAEKPTKYLSQLYVQTNKRWGTIHLIIRREHDGQFWFMNIDSANSESFADIGIETE